MADEIKIHAPAVEQNINVNVTGEAEIHRLYTELQAAQASLDRVNSTLHQTESELDRVRSQFDNFAHGNGIDILQEELERFKSTAQRSVQEFRTFLESVNLNDVYGNNDWQFEELFDRIRDGSITASQAILKVKTDFSALMEESYHTNGGLFDSQMVQGFTASLEHLGEVITDIVRRLDSIEQNGVGAIGGSGGNIAHVLQQIEAATAGMSEEAKSAYEPITQLVRAMTDYANLDSTRILGVSQAFRNIADIGSGNYGTKSIENIIYLAKQLQALNSNGSLALRFDITGFDGLKVSKASLNNLATYLPQIAKVNATKLEDLARVDLTNFNNVRVNKSSIENITQLSDAFRLLREAVGELVKVAPQLSAVDAAFREIQTTNNKINSSYRATAQMLGGENATGQNASDLELLKQKYADLTLAAETFRAAKTSATQADIDNIYRLQAEMQTLIASVQERINLEHESAAASAASAEEEIAAAEKARLEKEKANKVELEKQSLLRKAITLLTQMQHAEQGWTAAKHGKTATSYADIQSQIKALQELTQAYQAGDISVEEFKLRLTSLSTEFKVSSGVIKSASEDTKTFGERIGSLSAKFGTWFSITRVIMAVFRTMRQMVSAAIELDDAMTQLQIVTRDTDATLERFGDTIAETAKRVGSSVTDLVDSSTTFARLGYSLEDSARLAEFTAMLQNVGNIDVNDAQDAITAIVKAFDIDVDEIESVMDKLVITGNNFPISVSQIAEGMNNASSTLAAAGNTFEQSVALLTAANTTIQNAAKSSTGLRTIAARIRNTKTELDELGEVMTEANYEDLVKQLTNFNVALTDTNGEYRSTYDIMADIASKWSHMNSMQQAALATALSGTRQQAVFYSIIEQFQEASGAMDAMSSSAGTLQESYSTFLESTTAHINTFKAAFQQLSAGVFESGFLQFFIDAGTGIINFLVAIDNIIDKLGGFKTVILATVSALLIARGGLIAYKVQMIATAAVQKIITFFTGVKTAILNLIDVIPKAIVAWKAYAAGTASASAAMQASIPVIGLVIAALTLLVGALSLYHSKTDEATQKTMESANAASQLSKDISDLTYEYLALSDAVNTDNSAKDSLLDIQEKLIKKLSLEKDRISELTKQYGLYTDAIKAAAVEKLRESELDIRGGLNAARDKAISATDEGFFGADNAISINNHLTNGFFGASDETRKKQIQLYNGLKALEKAGFISSSTYSTYDDTGTKYSQGFAFHAGLDKDLDTVEGVLATYKELGDMLYVVSSTIGSDNVLYEAIYNKYNMLSESAGAYKDKIGELNTNLAEQYTLSGLIGKDIPTTKDGFDEYRQGVIDAAIASEKFIGATSDIENAIDGVLSEQSQFAGFYQDAAAAMVAEVGKASHSLSDLSDTLTELKSAYSLLEKAQAEMSTGGLSADTIKAMADATDDYLDYLYEENGIIKLNTDAWKKFANAKMSDSISAIIEETERLKAEREEIKANLEEWENKDAEYPSRYEKIEEYTRKLDENSAAIERNENLLGIYSTLYDNITSQLDAYSSALANFTNVASAINGVSDALTTVADLQETVADGFTLSLEKALEFAAIYPEILNRATVSADGQIALNEDVVNAFIEGKEAELKSQIDAKIAELEADRSVLIAKKEFAETELELAKNVGRGEGQIARELAEYRVNAGNAVAKAFIESGMDAATAYQLAMAAMSQNSEEFDNIAAQICTDVAGNFDAAAYSAAQTIYNNMKNASSSLDGLIGAAHNAAAAIAGVGSGTQAGSTGAFSGSGGSFVGGVTIGLSHGTFNGVDYSYAPKTVRLDQFISDLELDISNYSNAIAQIDGQIATLKALRNTSLNKFSSSSKKASSGSGSGSDSSAKEESWFERQYKLHQHLLNMDAEEVEDYLDWLNEAYQRAYKEGIIALDDFYKYQEEVYKELQALFKDYLNDIEHEISMRSEFEGENKKIISLYKKLIADVEKEITAARSAGLDDTDDYIQELQKKWASYRDSIKDIEGDVKDNAKDAIDELVDIRLKMLKQDIDNEKEAIRKRLDYLKDFYQKQKDMLQDVYDEEKYLEEQSEKRKAVADIQAELAQLEYDNSAWAQKRKLQLAQELADAQKDLDDFERDHALQAAKDELDKLYEMQEAELNAQTELLEGKESNAKALYDQALEDIKHGSIELYNEMIEWNNVYGDGISDTIKTAWEEAYKALQDYKDLYGTLYNGINLDNATGYTKPNESWDTASVSGTNPDNGSSSGGGSSSSGESGSASSSGTTVPQLDEPTKRKVAAAIWNGGYGWGPNPDRANRLTEVFGANNGIQDLVNKGVGCNDAAPGNDYTYLNMRKKFKGYASGTRKAIAGMHAIDELGTETIFQSADGTKYKMFTGGEKVLNAKASNFLYDFANKGSEILDKIIRSFFGGGIAGITPSVINNDIKMGDIIVQGNADSRTVSEMRRAQRESVEAILKEFNRLNK